jgi:hypothetical protein
MKVNLLILTILIFVLAFVSTVQAAGYLTEPAITNKTRCYDDGSDTHGSVKDSEGKLVDLYNTTIGGVTTDILEKMESKEINIDGGKNIAVYIIGKKSMEYYDITLASTSFASGTLKLQFKREGNMDSLKKVGVARKIFKVWLTNPENISPSKIDKVEFYFTDQDKPFSTWIKGQQ